jgi:RHS repeat-associated protein
MGRKHSFLFGAAAIGIFSLIIGDAGEALGQTFNPPPNSSLPNFANLAYPFPSAPTPPMPASSAGVRGIRSMTSNGAFPTQAAAPDAYDFQSCGPNADVPPQAIYDLATALKNDPQAIYHFVHDNVDLELGVESSKGALGTYLDRSGDSFDQAALLLALLTVAANTNTAISNPQIVIGVEKVTAAQFGLANLTSQMLIDAGDDPTWAASSKMPYAWVQVTVNGQSVVMDPAAKTYTVISGTNVSQYAPSAPSQSVSSIESYLSAFSTNLYTESTWQNATQSYYRVPLYIGGRFLSVTPTSPTYNPNGLSFISASPNTGSGVAPSTTPVNYARMPYNFRTAFEVLLQGEGSVPSNYVCLDQIYGHNTQVYFTNFLVDGVTVFSGNGSQSPSSDTFNVVHQVWTAAGALTYPWYQSATESLSSLNGATLQFAVGRVGAFRVRELTTVAEYEDIPGFGLTANDFNEMGANQLRQTSYGLQMLDQLAGTYTNVHHTVQFERYVSASPYIWIPGTALLASIDTPMTSTSVDTVTSSPGSGLTGISTQAVAYALSSLQSAQEAAALNNSNATQAVSAATEVALASTPGNLTTLLKGSNPNNWPQALYSNYSTAQLQTVYDYTANGYDVTVPTSAAPWGSGSTAIAFLASQAGGTSAFVLQTPNGTYKGASSPNAMQPSGTSLGIGDAQSQSGPATGGLSASGGTVSFAAPLLSVGSKGSPYSLGFALSYSSTGDAQASFGTTNAPGWNHNYNRKLLLTSDPSALIGSDLTPPALPAIAALVYMLQSGNQLASYYASGGTYPTSAALDLSAAASWYLNQTVNDVATIARGNAREVFLRMPDGTYHTVGPSGESLKVVGSNLVWYAPNQDSETYPAAGGPISKATTVSGVTTSFNYSTCSENGTTLTVLSSVVAGAHRLGFSYTPYADGTGTCLLSTVYDENARSITLNYTQTLGVASYHDLNSVTLVDSTNSDVRQLTFGYTGVSIGDYWPSGNVASTLTSVSAPTITSKAVASKNPATVNLDTRLVPVSFTNPNGHITTYFTAGNRSEVDSAMGEDAVSYSYPVFYLGDWQELDTYDPLGNESSTLSNRVGQVIWKKTPLGQTNSDLQTNYTYDAYGYPTSVAMGSGSQALTQSTVWDPTYHTPTSSKDPNGNTTTFRLDGLGRLYQKISPTVPCATSLSECSSGQIAPTTTYQYTSTGQIQQVTAPDGEVTVYSYDPNAATGNLVSVVVDSGTTPHKNLTTTMTYDSVGNVNTVEQPDGVTVGPASSYTSTANYDAARRVTTVYNPPSEWAQSSANPELPITYTYDEAGDLLAVQRDAGFTSNGSEQYFTTVYTYYTPGQKETVTRSGKTAGGPVTNPGSTITAPSDFSTYVYDADERISTVTDPAGQETLQTYDGDGRAFQKFAVKSSGNELLSTETYTADGLPYQVIDGDASTGTSGASPHALVYGYDSYDRLETKTYADGTFTQYTLDNDGQVKQIADRQNNSFVYTMDALERVGSETDTPSGAGQSTYTRSTTYDPMGRVISLSDPFATLNYVWDTAGRETQTTTVTAAGQSRTVGVQYDADGNTTQITYPDSYVYTYSIDNLGFLTQVAETAPGGSSASPLATFQYYTGGELSQASYANGASEQFTIYDMYDGLNQISNTFSTSSQNFTVTYPNRDGDERRTEDQFSDGSYVWHPAAAGTTQYGTTGQPTNGLNQYSSINNAPLSYTANGNLATDASAPLGSATYTWDIFNRLTAATNNSYSATYTYDPLGRRIGKTVSTAVSQFAYFGQNAIAVYNKAGTELRHYVYGSGSTAILEEVFSGGAISASNYHHIDALGTPLAISGSNGNVKAKYPTSPWGEISSGSGTDFHFAGMFYDSETQLYYDNARYYSPVQGRFISPDPIGVNGGINIYAYAGNDPINGVDLTGLDYDSECESTTCTHAGGSGDGGGGYDPSYGDPGGMFPPGYAYYNGLDAAQGNDGYSVTTSDNYSSNGDYGAGVLWTPSDTSMPTYYRSEETYVTGSPAVGNFPEIVAGTTAVWGSVPPGIADPFAGQASTTSTYLSGFSSGTFWGAIGIVNGIPAAIGTAGGLAVTAAGALAAEEAGGETITLYRGVDAAHPGYADALNGVANPIGGDASIAEHVFGGNTASAYTSWTTDFGTAEGFATQESGSGAVLSKSFPLSGVIPSPGNAAGMGEFEYLIQGPVTGADVMRVPAW